MWGLPHLNRTVSRLWGLHHLKEAIPRVWGLSHLKGQSHEWGDCLILRVIGGLLKTFLGWVGGCLFRKCSVGFDRFRVSEVGYWRLFLELENILLEAILKLCSWLLLWQQDRKHFENRHHIYRSTYTDIVYIDRKKISFNKYHIILKSARPRNISV